MRLWEFFLAVTPTDIPARFTVAIEHNHVHILKQRNIFKSRVLEFMDQFYMPHLKSVCVCEYEFTCIQFVDRIEYNIVDVTWVCTVHVYV